MLHFRFTRPDYAPQGRLFQIQADVCEEPDEGRTPAVNLPNLESGQYDVCAAIQARS